jgi:Protein of unknown function (DUF3105)
VATQKKLAKQVRLDERAQIIQRRAQVEARNRNIVIAVFLVLVVGGSGLLYFLVNPPGFLQGAAVTSGAHTAVYSVPDEGHTHVADGTPLAPKHQPPSSGNHYPSALPLGTYSVAQPAGNWVHSLEHGYIVVVFRCTDLECKDLNSQAQTIMQSLPTEKYNEVKFVSTPYQTMTPKIAVLAWGKEQDMDLMDPQLITAFYKQNVDHGLQDLP